MQAVEMHVRDIRIMHGHIARHGVFVRWKIIDEAELECIAGADPKRWPWKSPPVGAQENSHVADPHFFVFGA